MTIKASYHSFSGGMISFKDSVSIMPQFKEVMKKHGFMFHSIKKGEAIYVNYLHSLYDIESSTVKIIPTELTSDLYSTITFDTGEHLIIGSGVNNKKAFNNVMSSWNEKLRPIDGRSIEKDLSEITGRKVEVECFLN